MPAVKDFDVLIIGSGFGGSTTAMRLMEKGYRVGIVEAGRRFEDDDFAKTSWRLNRFLWAPKFGLMGIQRIHWLKDVVILAGAGVGGGSLNYANTLYKPPTPFFTDPQWAHITDWEDELSPYYDQARRMLGVVPSPRMTPADHVMKEVANEMGVGDTFGPTPVGVFFGETNGGKGKPGETVADPYFGGAGPERTACTECGACMTGCRVGAKNTLMKNYLNLAERAGAQVLPETTAERLQQNADGSWRVQVRNTRSWGRFRRRRRSLTADHVVLAAGTYNTQKLLHMSKERGDLPRLTDSLGHLTRTNSEAILGAMSKKVDANANYSEGVAITSSFHPAPDTHVEPVRYGKGSNAMALMQTALTQGDGPRSRPMQVFDFVRNQPGAILQILNVRRWSERTIIVLVMQNRNNSLTTFVRKWGPWRSVSSRQGHGEPNPTWVPKGNEATEILADKIGGIPGGTWGDMLNKPMTAHYLGGAVISDDPNSGVIDPYHRVWNYPTLHVADGAAISANLGVNPSLSICAQAERAASFWPNRGEQDTRPEQGIGYERISPVSPRSPIVPSHAPGALRLPIIPINESA